jgi:LCP family protein required for cell wall assembly
MKASMIRSRTQRLTHPTHRYDHDIPSGDSREPSAIKWSQTAHTRPQYPFTAPELEQARFSLNQPCYNANSKKHMEAKSMTQPSSLRSRSKMTPLMWVLLVIFIVLTLIVACLTFFVVREMIISRIVGGFVTGPQLTTAEAGSQTYGLQTPLQPVGGPTPRAWEGSERVNILVMGLDYRDWEGGGPSRTDTMILTTIDPVTRSAGIFSIPRDLWVDIPGFGYGKINTAYYLGELYQVDGGGPALAIQTVEKLLGVEINYYAQVDFNAFVEFVDLIGGIDVEVPESLRIDPLGPKNTIYLDPGLQHLDGEQALAYARNRDTIGSDFDRAKRQQQVIMAIRDQVINLELMPELLQKSPLIYQQLASGVRTNMNLETILSLARLAVSISKEGIIQRSIGPDQVTMSISPDGLDILLPDTDAIRMLRDEVFNVSEAFEPQAVTVNLQELTQEEAATISVLNATYTPGLAAATSDFLTANEFLVSNTGNAQQVADQTSVILYTSKPYTIQRLLQVMNLDESRIYSSYDPNSTVDIVILLGNDWAQDNPMP